MDLELLWGQLAARGEADVQTRVDARHPRDLYADVQRDGRVGLVAICAGKPPELRPIHAIAVERGRRTDGRWTFRLSLVERCLLPVFAALCCDIIDCTRSGVDESQLGIIVVRRVMHWRSLLDGGGGGLGEMVLRGLIGELAVMERRLLQTIGLLPTAIAWRGPLGGIQDFVLPDGSRIEVKTISSQADQARINGLAQLDAGDDQLVLIVVRADPVAPETKDAVTAPKMIERMKAILAAEPEALIVFETALRALHWHEDPSNHLIALRLSRLDEYQVTESFPRLTREMVPAGIIDADYAISLPRREAETRQQQNDR